MKKRRDKNKRKKLILLKLHTYKMKAKRRINPFKKHGMMLTHTHTKANTEKTHYKFKSEHCKRWTFSSRQFSSSHSFCIQDTFKEVFFDYSFSDVMLLLIPKKKKRRLVSKNLLFFLVHLCRAPAAAVEAENTYTRTHLGNCNVFSYRIRKTCCLKGKPQRTLSFSYTC